jgi:hypothetical protein
MYLHIIHCYENFSSCFLFGENYDSFVDYTFYWLRGIAFSSSSPIIRNISDTLLYLSDKIYVL